MDIRAYNRGAWDQEVARQNPWTVPVSAAAIEAARNGRPKIVLTPQKTVPEAWLGKLAGREVLCLASGGGQQGPLLAAAGARVTVFDNSPAQLRQDRLVAEREGLEMQLIEGDMRDLSGVAAGHFDLIVHPVSNLFVPDILPVWRECHRVLKPSGALLAGFTLPCLFIFDDTELEAGNLVVRHSIPYSDVTDLTDAERQHFIDRQEPLQFGHSLDDQIGGQLRAGLVLVDFYEDVNPTSPLARHLPTFAATRAEKPRPRS